MASNDLARGVRRALSGGLAMLLLGTAACGDGPVTPSSPAGLYTLVQAAGHPLPGTVFDGTIDDPTGATPSFHLQFVATSGSLTLTDDGRYQHAVDLTATIDGARQPATRWRDRLEVEDSLVVRLVGKGPPTRFAFVRP